MTFYEL
jgi:hypothetical protein